MRRRDTYTRSPCRTLLASSDGRGDGTPLLVDPGAASVVQRDRCGGEEDARTVLRRVESMKNDLQWSDLAADVDRLLQARADRWDRVSGDTTDEGLGAEHRAVNPRGVALLILPALLKTRGAERPATINVGVA